MFELLFKYPQSVFTRGTFVLLGGWPLWLLGVAILVAAARLRELVWNRTGGGRMAGFKSVAVWLLQTLLAAVLLTMLWHPALSVATLRPQQNIVAVVVDDSASMAIEDAGGGVSRKARAVSVLDSGLVRSLQQ